MACHTLLESDPVNHRVVTMSHECGIQFRANLITELGGKIDLHEHSYDHVAMILGGKFECVDIDPAGTEKRFVVASPEFGDFPFRITVPKFHRHGFTLLEKGNAPAQVLCMWGEP